MMQVYADNAATTKLSETALQAMLPYLTDTYGNASSLYRIGQEAHHGVQAARAAVATALGADANEIYFTSGGSEADNWAIKGVAELMAKKGKKHIITSAFEHHAVLHTVKKLEAQGFRITYLPVYENGIVKAEDVKNAICDDTALVTIMYANNEIGTIQPVSEIGAVCREKGVLFHTDAVQAVGHVAIDVKAQNIDLLSMSAHKFHGPKGVGALYCKKGIRLPNLIEGGAQERGRRAGTEAVYAMAGMAAALTEATEHLAQNTAKLTALRDRLIDGLLQVESSRLNGDRKAFPLRQAQRVRQARLTRVTFCWQSVCRTRWRTALYGCRFAKATPKKKSTISFPAYPKSSNGFAICRPCGKESKRKEGIYNGIQ